MPARAPSLSYVKGIHNVKAGVTYQHTFLTENDTLGIVDPTLNAPLLECRRKSRHDPIADQSGGMHWRAARRIRDFIPLLGCYDLTRTGTLPASMAARAQPADCITFRGHADIKELALYIQDSIIVAQLDLQPGAPRRFYNGITSANQAEPRVGVAYNIKRPILCCGSPTPARWRRRSMRTWCLRAPAATTR